MTIPIQTPQIGTTGVVQPRNFLDEIAPYLQALAQQQTASAQAQSVHLLAEERRQRIAQTARDLQDQADAAKAFYMHLSGGQELVRPTQPGKDGAMPHPGPHEGVSSLMARPDIVRTLSPGALEHYGKFISDYNATVQQRTQAIHEQAQTELATTQNAILGDQTAREQTTRDILTRYGARIANPGVRARALTEIGAAAGPEIGNRVAAMFNSAFPEGPFSHFVGPDGFAYKQDLHSGRISKDVFVGQKVVNNLRLEAIQRNAAVLENLLEAQHQIVTQGIKGSKNPTLAQLAQTSHFLGIDTEAFANLLRNDPQQATQLLKTRFAHNFVGMLPNSRSAANLLQNLAESYWAPSGSGQALLVRTDRDREHLKVLMHQIANGQLTDLSKLGPEFSAALAAWAADQGGQGGAGVTGQQDPNAPPPNPMDWQQGVPPP